MNLYKRYKEKVLHYVYLSEDFYIKTYAIIKKDNNFYKIYLQQFNYIWQGDNIIEKLTGRGYVPIEHVLRMYDIDKIEDLEEQKTKKKIVFFNTRK